MYHPTQAITNILIENQELEGVFYAVVHYYDGFVIRNYRLRYKQEGLNYFYQYIKRGKDGDRILVGKTEIKEVVHDFDESEHNEVVKLCSIKYSANQVSQICKINECLLINPLFKRIRYGFEIVNGWDNLDRVTFIRKNEFLFKLRGWFPLESKEPIKLMIGELRTEDEVGDVKLDWDDINKGLCSDGITKFLFENPEFQELISIPSSELLDIYSSPELLQIIREKRIKLYNE